MRAGLELGLLAMLALGGEAFAQNQRLPPLGLHYDSQLGGAYDPAPGVGIVSRDRAEAPFPGVYNICYVNAFQTQPQETDWWRENHPDLLLRDASGALLEDENWPGEYLLDITTREKRLALVEIVGRWIDRCAASGFQAVELDNLDSWGRSAGLVTMDHAIDYSMRLSRRAHDRDLAFAQKNAAELAGQGPILGFDFVITESCAVYDECDDYAGWYGPYVLEIEYDRTIFEAACAARTDRHPIVLRDRLLSPAGAEGHVFKAC